MTLLILAKAIAIINLTICIFLFILKRKKNSPFQFFYLILAGLVVWPSIFDKVNVTINFHALANSFYFSTYDYVNVQLIIFGQLFVFLVLELSFKSSKIELVKNENNHAEYINFLPFFALVGFTVYILYIFGYEYISNIDFVELREGRLNKYYLAISYFSILSAFLPAYALHYKKNWYLAIVVFFVFIFIYLFFGGSRQTLVIASFLLIIPFVDKLKFSTFLFVLSIAIGFSFFDTALMVIKFLRNASSFEERIYLISNIFNGSIDLKGTSSDGNLRQVFYNLVAQELPSDFQQFKYLGRSLLFWMPSQFDIFNIKPTDFEVDVFAFVMNGRDGTMHSTYFGSVFADSGHLFIIWNIFSFILMRSIEYIISKSLNPFFLWSLGVYFSIMMARGALYAVIVVFFVGTLLTMLKFLSKIKIFNGK